jgi:hypothetical protein
MPEDLLTTSLAVWGAVLSTVLAVLKVMEYRRDRASLVIQLSHLRMELDPGEPDKDVMWFRRKSQTLGGGPPSFQVSR